MLGYVLKDKVLCRSPRLKTFLSCSRLTCLSVNQSLTSFHISLSKCFSCEKSIFIDKCHNTFYQQKWLKQNFFFFLNLCQIFSISPVALGVNHFLSHFDSIFQLSYHQFEKIHQVEAKVVL